MAGTDGTSSLYFNTMYVRHVIRRFRACGCARFRSSFAICAPSCCLFFNVALPDSRVNGRIVLFKQNDKLPVHYLYTRTGEAGRHTGDGMPAAAAEADGQTQARWHGSISAALELITAPLLLPLASGCASWTLVYESQRCSKCKQGRQRKSHNNKL